MSFQYFVYKYKKILYASCNLLLLTKFHEFCNVENTKLFFLLFINEKLIFCNNLCILKLKCLKCVR